MANMTDINQWRRMIQPTRARTPAIEQQEEYDSNTSPTTPKRAGGLRPMLSSYFNTHTGSGVPAKAEASFGDHGFISSHTPWPHHEETPSPSAEGLIETAMCRLMNSPYEGLGVEMNGPLLLIFEAWRNLSDEKVQLEVQLEIQLQARRADSLRIQQMQSRWDEERQDYKAEVKRLELILAKGKRGLAEVTLARQDSLLRQRDRKERQPKKVVVPDDGLETIFEVLERARRVDDNAWSSQRATFRVRGTSPSAHMRHISQQLASKKSMTSIHADLPFGTPPHVSSTLAEASMLDAQLAFDKAARAEAAESEPKTSFSDDTFGSSVLDDLFPDEAGGQQSNEDIQQADNLAAVQRIADMLARRQNADPGTILPRLLDMFRAEPDGVTGREKVSIELSLTQATKRRTGVSSSRLASASVQKPEGRSPRSISMPNALGMQTHTSAAPSSGKATVGSGVHKHPSLMAKASGFFQKQAGKLKPQLHVDTAISHNAVPTRRRFSFEAGDDTVAFSAPGASTTDGYVERDLTLRKSVSMMSLPAMHQQVETIQRTLSPVAQSPTTSAPPSESRRMSRIPTPVYHSASRPRKEREDSCSSLLTAIKHSENVSRRSSSQSSSPPETRTSSAPWPSRPNSLASAKLPSNKSLLDHTNALRGNLSASATMAAQATVSDQDVTESSSAVESGPLGSLLTDQTNVSRGNASAAVRARFVSSGPGASENNYFSSHGAHDAVQNRIMPKPHQARKCRWSPTNTEPDMGETLQDKGGPIMDHSTLDHEDDEVSL